MRKTAIGVATVLTALVAVAAALAGPSRTATPSAACAMARFDTVSSGKLTVGTDNPAYPPWFGGSPPKGSKWKISDPASGKGFESAVAYAVAAQLGFSRSEVVWTYVPFNRAYAPGSKSFDVDVNQISYSPARAKVVDFSASYYDVNQAIVVLKGSKIAGVRTLAGLRGYKLGAQLGTTSYAYIKERVKPSTTTAVFPSNSGATQALKNKQIDGLVVDLPTAFYISAAVVSNSTIRQFPAVPGGEHFGMVLAKGNPLVACVNSAVATLRRNGTLKAMQQKWLANATGAPVLK
jgi:polar amino acid transport system substrate-binding protein